MIKKLISLGLIIILLMITGCIFQDPSNNNHNQNDNTTFSLATTMPSVNQLNKQMDLLHHNHTTTPYEMQNLTGFNNTWYIQEGVFSIFACNTSRLEISIIRLDTKENAELNIQQKKVQLTSYDFIDYPMDPLGDSSFLMKNKMPFKDDEIDVWELFFSYDEIIVNIKGYASDVNDIIEYAQLIEGNIQQHSQ